MPAARQVGDMYAGKRYRNSTAGGFWGGCSTFKDRAARKTMPSVRASASSRIRSEIQTYKSPGFFLLALFLLFYTSPPLSILSPPFYILFYYFLLFYMIEFGSVAFGVDVLCRASSDMWTPPILGGGWWRRGGVTSNSCATL